LAAAQGITYHRRFSPFSGIAHPMREPVLAIARYTWMEARRNRLLWLAALVLVAGLGLASLLSQAALTEARELQLAVLAALYRLAAVFIVSAFIITSMVRENADKALEVFLAMPLPRTAFLLGRLLGFSLCALALAAVATLPLFALAPASSVAAWAASLAAELLLMSAMALFCVVTLTQILPALAATFAFYLLARSITALQLVGSGPLAGDTLAQQVMNGVLAAIAFVLPRLDGFSQTAWLIHSPPSGGELLAVAAQTAVYFVLLASAALFDFHRKSL
jgi:ABC-type transport system involved in multi-copper enzyme maturation permease subunit